MPPNVPSSKIAIAARRMLKVSILGLPNAGKSTLINSLLSTVVNFISYLKTKIFN